MTTLKPLVVPPGAGQLINHVRLKVRSEHTAGSYLVIEVEHEPGDGIPPHQHSVEDEIAYIVEGTAEMTVGDETHIATSGTTVFLPKNVPHGYMAVGDERLEMMWTVIPGRGFEDMFLAISKLPAGELNAEKMAEIASEFGIEFVGSMVER